MGDSIAAPISFVIPGRSVAPTRARGAAPVSAGPLPGGFLAGRVKESVRVGANRDAGVVRVVAVPGEDVVVLGIDGGPELMLHPETARDLLLAQAGGQLSRGATVQADGRVTADEVQVPSTLRWRGLEPAAATQRGVRDVVGGIVLKTVDLLTGVVKDKAAEMVAGALARRVDAQVNPGVYKLNAASLPPLKPSKNIDEAPPGLRNGELLVFVHGTFSNSSSAFQKLWRENSREVQSVFDRYQGAVYALDHPTLSVSPIANAITLAKALPPDARLHLVTHSRGGLVAEVLARVCGSARISEGDLGAFVAEQRKELIELAGLVKHRRIHVDRIVRVACPARGTLLASRRLDAYLSVFKWTLELAGVQVLPELVDFLGAVAQRREQANELPGLEAQMPDSPLVRWLHSVNDPIPGQLRVVAGDIEGDSLTSWVKTLLADGFYWTDNDFVVQTRSMYGGPPREAGATFLLDQGGKVSHSAYFAKGRAAGAVFEAILNDDPSGFRVVGPLSWRGESSSGDREATPASDGKAATGKPAVFILPGMLGSHLKAEGQRIWLAPLSAGRLDRLKYDSGVGNGIEPDGLVSDRFDDLIAYLTETHQPIAFPYDWRQPLEVEASRLADRIEDALDARSSSRQPVRILAYSSGGLLARALQLERPEVWERMMATAGSRIVMLGTPNGGTYAPMQVLSGDETFGGMLGAGAVPFGEAEVRGVMGTFPGFLQLQAGLLNARYGLGDHATWERLAEADAAAAQQVSAWHALPLQRRAYHWGLPTQDALNRAVALRKRLDDQAKTDLGDFAKQLAIVVGCAKYTPDGFEESSAGGFVYLDAQGRGDGRVTLQNALLPGISAWSVDCDHGRLPAHRDAFRAYVELLDRGATNRLPPVVADGTTRDGSGAALPSLRSRPSRSPATMRPPESENDILSVSTKHAPAEGSAVGRALHITVVNGDLMFVQHPILLGHYLCIRLTGTELVMDALVGNSMSRSLEIDLYPDSPGTHQIFMNVRHRAEDTTKIPRPQAVVVVGLGEEGKLTATKLVHTVRQGVIAWAQRVAEQPGAPAVFDLAATLIGSGGKGIGVGQSAQLIAEAVREANDNLASIQAPRVGELRIIELYLDRATEAWRALQLQAQAAPGRYVVADTVHVANGALRRPLDSNYRGADYDFITAVERADVAGQRSIAYSLDTKRARTEVTAQTTQAPLLSELVSASNTLAGGADIGRALFNILVPMEIEPFLGGSTEMVIELDRGTAGIPWELLDTNAGVRQEAEPWAIRSKLVRKLRTEEFRRNVADAGTEERVLIIGEPQCDARKYPRLPGARTEAIAVAERLCGTDGLEMNLVSRLVSPDDQEPGPDALAVLTALHQRPWRIVHIAGHGEPATEKRLGGVVLSLSGSAKADAFLSATEIGTMRVVPELVFVNCCHLAVLAPESPKPRPYDRPRFASGIAEELIKIGVRCVVAAGWAVDDRAAKVFALAFYDALLNRERFIDAVAKARRAARALGGNTWAAYQCYGDPEWTFVRGGADAQGATEAPWSRRFAGVASSPALKLALDTIAVKSRFHKKPDEPEHKRIEDLREGIRHLEERFDSLWGHIGEVAEAFGSARAEIGDLTEAIEWYRRAVAANDGTASLKAAEQLGNLRARLAWEKVSELVDTTGATPPADKALRAAANEIRDAIVQLEKLVAVQQTMERESLIGSAYKRLAMVCGAGRNSEDEKVAIEDMKCHYAVAEGLGRASKSADLLYPAVNHLVAQLAMSAGDPAWPGPDAASVETVRNILAKQVRDDPDFWSVVGETELRMYEAVARRDLATAREGLEDEFRALKERVPAAKMWSSVHDNARFVLRCYAKRARDYGQAADALSVQEREAEAQAADELSIALHRFTRDGQTEHSTLHIEAPQSQTASAGSGGQSAWSS